MKAWKVGALSALMSSALAGAVAAAPAAAAPAKPADPPKTQVVAPAVAPHAPGISVAQPDGAPAAPAAPTGPVGKLEVKETVFDAGTVERGAEITHAFQLKNIGKGDLTVDAKPG